MTGLPSGVGRTEYSYSCNESNAAWLQPIVFGGNMGLVSATAIIILVLAGSLAQAETPQLKDRQTGKYLGNLSANPYDPNSTSNPQGQYGSKYSPDSINNPYGRYGSPYSNDSANNPYATNPPAIIDPK
ncbi:MAG: hypothetical protein ABIW02_01990 [Nitrosospira sp.]